MAKKFSTLTCQNEACGAWTTVFLHKDGDDDVTTCEFCNHTSRGPAPSLAHGSRVEKNRYPYISGSFGEVVTSRDHENALAKKTGAVPVDHWRVKASKRTWSNRKYVKGPGTR